MNKISLFLILFALIKGPLALAQSGTTDANWRTHNFITIDSVYHSFNYEEPNVMTEEGGVGGVRGEVGVLVLPWLNISVEGNYWDGRLFYKGSTFSGAAAKTITADYVSDVRTFAHIFLESFTLSLGYATRNWYNDLVVSYRRRTEYTYNPVLVTYNMNPFYMTFEYDNWVKGVNRTAMSDVGGGRNDVTLDQKDGSGYGMEIGYLIDGAPAAARLFLKYHKWEVDASEVGNDGVENVVEPKNNTVTYTAGVGFIL